MSHLDAIHPQDVSQQDHATLRVISGRVRWLATAIIDQANRGRPNPTGVKVGGHQASSASITVSASLVAATVAAVAGDVAGSP